MSPSLRFSLAGNVLLLAALGAVLAWRHPVVESVPPAIPAPLARESHPAPGVAPGVSAAVAADSLREPEVVAQLARIGVTAEVLANALIEAGNRQAAARVAALQQKYSPQPAPERELRALARAADAEQERVLRAALGEDGYRAWDKTQVLRTLNRARAPGDELALTDAEAEQAYRLQKAFDEEYKELREAMEDGVADKADASALQARAQQTLDRELALLLGPERLAALRGTPSPAAEVARTYGALSPTPAQTQGVLAAEGDRRAREAELLARLRQAPADAATVVAELQAMDAARDENLRRIFGAAAYDALTQQQDPTYQTLRQFAQTWELDDAQVQSVYTALQGFHAQADRLRTAATLRESAGQPGNWTETNAAIEQARRAVESDLQAAIGAERLQRIKNNDLLGSH